MKKLYHNARFYTMEDETSFYEAILCEDGVVVDTFFKYPEHIECELVDLQGNFVFPGFVDSHTHSFEGGLYQNGVDLSDCESIPDILDKLYSAQAFSDMIFAWKFDELSVSEKRFPTKSEIDKIYPAIPVLLRRVDGHSCVVNTAAMRKIIDSHGVTDFPTDGLLRSELNDLAAHSFHKSLDFDSVLHCFKTAADIAIANGHTGIHTMIGDAKSDFMYFEQLLSNSDKFDIDYTFYPQCFDIDGVTAVYEKLNWTRSRRIGGCILADGSFGSRSAAISEPYLGSVGENGILYQTSEYWDKFFVSAQAKELQVGVHCIGDRAISQIISAITQAKIDNRAQLRHQIIHAEYLTDEMIEQMSELKISAVIQPMFDSHWGGENGFYASVLGTYRIRYINRFRSLIEAGVLVTGSSDWYITDLSALAGIQAAISHQYKPERLTNFEAIKLYTTNPHKLAFSEVNRGYIKKGYEADFVVLDADIMNLKNVRDANIVGVISNRPKGS
jgi:hypothetical protein